MRELLTISPTLQALPAGLLTWLLTALGAALVLLLRRPRPAVLDSMLSFGAGVMLAASFFSLLGPAVDLAAAMGQPFTWAALGFFSGGVLLLIADGLLAQRLRTAAARSDGQRRTALLIAAITLHNIPEGLAIGVAFGAAALQPSALSGAWALALGVALQNFPEGAAVSLPLYREGMQQRRAFFWGQASAWVEPIAAVIGALLATLVRPILPFALAFAAGAMVLVVLCELAPESQRSPLHRLMAAFTLIGFTLMMILDVVLG